MLVVQFAMSSLLTSCSAVGLSAVLSLTVTFSALCQEAPAQDATKYCASVGTDDEVRPIPPELVPQALRLFYSVPVDSEQVRRSTVYRCMDGAVWLCNYGANLICAKADISRTSRGRAKILQREPRFGSGPDGRNGACDNLFVGMHRRQSSDERQLRDGRSSWLHRQPMEAPWRIGRLFRRALLIETRRSCSARLMLWPPPASRPKPRLRPPLPSPGRRRRPAPSSARREPPA